MKIYCLIAVVAFCAAVEGLTFSSRPPPMRERRSGQDKLIPADGDGGQVGKRYIIKFKDPRDNSEREKDETEDDGPLDDIIDGHEGDHVINPNNPDEECSGSGSGDGSGDGGSGSGSGAEKRSARIAAKRELRRRDPSLQAQHVEIKRLLRVHQTVESFGCNGTGFDHVDVIGCKEGQDKNECDGHINEGNFNGIIADVTDPEELKKLLDDPDVEYVEEDRKVKVNACSRTSASQYWGLDQMDTADGSMKTDSYFSYLASGGQGVYVYVVDTGVNTAHAEFEGRASWGTTTCTGVAGIACQAGKDNQGHGTHCAGTVAGKTAGVARKANIIAVKSLGDDGSGTGTTVMQGLQWAFNDIKSKGRVGKAVISMSLGGGKSQAENDLINQGYNEGIPSIVAAGNEDQDACNVSPASANYAFTVGSIKYGNARSGFSNWGSCVNFFAPGSSIRSASHSSTTGFTTMSGTSMATPAVAGAAAVFLSQVSNCNTPQHLYNWLIQHSKSGVTDLKTSPDKAIQVPCDISCPSSGGGSNLPAPTTTTTTTQSSGGGIDWSQYPCGSIVCFYNSDGSTTCYRIICY